MVRRMCPGSGCYVTRFPDGRGLCPVCLHRMKTGTTGKLRFHKMPRELTAEQANERIYQWQVRVREHEQRLRSIGRKELGS